MSSVCGWSCVCVLQTAQQHEGFVEAGRHSLLFSKIGLVVLELKFSAAASAETGSCSSHMQRKSKDSLSVVK